MCLTLSDRVLLHILSFLTARQEVTYRNVRHKF